MRGVQCVALPWWGVHGSLTPCWNWFDFRLRGSMCVVTTLIYFFWFNSNLFTFTFGFFRYFKSSLNKFKLKHVVMLMFFLFFFFFFFFCVCATALSGVAIVDAVVVDVSCTLSLADVSRSARMLSLFCNITLCCLSGRRGARVCIVLFPSSLYWYLRVPNSSAWRIYCSVGVCFPDRWAFSCGSRCVSPIIHSVIGFLKVSRL